MPEKESFDIDGLMVFRSDLTAVDQDGNIVNGVTTPDRYFPSDREPLSGEQIGRYTNTTAYWREHSTYIPLKGDVIIYSDGGSIEQGGVTVYVPKIKVGDGVTSIGNLPFTDSDNQGGAASLYISVTYLQLVAKISNSQLVKGCIYRITDYVTTTTQANTSSAGHAFDLVVTAIDVNELNCMASALLHSGDTYFSTAGADLSKWQIWYDVNNDTTKYAWADTANGKGVIYRMIDEFNNDCPYDFKNILFKREITSSGKFDSSNGTLSWVYTFGRKYAGNLIDASLSGNLHGVAQNKIGSYGSYLNNIVFLGGGTSHNTLQTECRNITIGNDTYGYGAGCACNKFDSECYNITIGDYCSGNIFRSGTHNVNLANDTINKTIGYDSSNSIRIYNENDAVLPALTDNAGKVLAVNSGATGAEWVKPVTIYSGSSAPSSSTGSEGDIYIQEVV